MFSFRPRLAVLSSLFVLAACSDAPTDNPDTPSPPAETQLTALVVGDADSPFLDVLTERTRMVQDDGSQKVVDHDLIIFDGDTHTPAALAEHPRLAEAMNEGTWVLMADASSAHKREGTLPHVGFATQADTGAYLFRSVPNDMPVFDILELPPLAANESQDAALSDEIKAEMQERQYRKFVERVVAKVGNGTTTQQAGGCASPLNITAGIIYATWCYGSPNDWDISSVSYNGDVLVTAGDTIRGNTVESQAGQNDGNFIFTLLLDNEDVVTGNSQTLHVAVDGQMTPTTTTWPAGIFELYNGLPYFLGEWVLLKEPFLDFTGYVQTKLELEMGPDDSSAGVLQPAAIFAPQTPNNAQTDTYSSSTTFSIGATLNAGAVPTGPTGGGVISATYMTTSTNTQSNVVNDWTWTAGLSGDNSYDWIFSSQNPPVGSSTLNATWDDGWADQQVVNGTLNQLNQSLMQYSAEAVWTTEALSSDTVQFDFGSTQHAVLLRASEAYGGPSFADEVEQSVSGTASIDLSFVNPVTLVENSLTFTDAAGNLINQDNPVSAGETVTATVNLSGEAPFSYTITSTATSENDNAVVTESPVRITKGDSSKTFTLETNANGLASGQTVAVDVFLGSFGSTAAQQLWISN